MQDDRRTNRDRTDSTRAALISAARALFVDKGYAATGTPEIVAAAGVTRGALYHHYADKEALFAAVVEAEAQAVTEAIEATSPAGDPLDMLIAGGRAFLDAMAVPGRVRLMLVEAPAVLGADRLAALDKVTGGATLVAGLEAAMKSGAIAPGPTGALAQAISAAYDRAALALAAGEPAGEWHAALARLIRGLAR